MQWRVYGGLELERPDRTSGQRLLEQAHRTLDLGAVPRSPILLREGDESLLDHAGGRACIAQQHQREQPGRLGVSRQCPVQSLREPDGVLRETGVHEIRTSRERGPGREDEVQDGAHRVQPTG